MKLKLSKKQIILLLVFCLIRILIAVGLGNSFDSGARHDDYMLVEYANLTEHYLHPNIWSLAKTMSYPLFLNLSRVTFIPYNILVTLFWILAAWMFLMVLRRFSCRPLIQIIGFLFVLFTPCAFDSRAGTKIYRNSILAVFIYIVFLAMILMLQLLWGKKKKQLNTLWIWSLILSAAYPFTFYIKEDGFWMKPVLYVFMAAAFAGLFYQFKYHKLTLSKIICCLLLIVLPWISFQAVTSYYQSVNEKYYGVSIINDRSEGELGEFSKLIYQIDSDQRTKYIWAPDDAIKKAFEASPTLQSMNGFEEAVLKSPWFHTVEKDEPIIGDFLNWVLPTALEQTGYWTSFADVQNIFKQVNSELREAFDNGTLKKDDRIQLVSNTGGRTMDELSGIWPGFWQCYNNALFLDGYRAGDLIMSYDAADIYPLLEELTHQSYAENEDGGIMKKTAVWLANLDFVIYRILNPLLLLIGIAGWFWMSVSMIIDKCRDPMKWLMVSIVFILTGVSLVYALGISWFSEFIHLNNESMVSVIKYYAVGIVPMIYLPIFLGTYMMTMKLLHLNTRTKRSSS